MNKEILVIAMIHNLPSNYNDYNYLLCNVVDGEMWFYSADNDIKILKKIVEENKPYLNQIIFELTSFDN